MKPEQLGARGFFFLGYPLEQWYTLLDELEESTGWRRGDGHSLLDMLERGRDQAYMRGLNND